MFLDLLHWSKQTKDTVNKARVNKRLTNKAVSVKIPNLNLYY